MAPEDVYNMDETSLFIVPNRTRNQAQGQFRGRKIQKDRLFIY